MEGEDSGAVTFNVLLHFLVTDAAKHCGKLDELLRFEDCVAMQLHEAALVVQRNWRDKLEQREQVENTKRKQRMKREGSFMMRDCRM